MIFILFLFFLLFLFVLIVFIDRIHARKFVDRYPAILYVGYTGSGKSINITADVYKHLHNKILKRFKWVVLTDDPSNCVPGAIYFNNLDFKSGKFLPCGKKGKHRNLADPNSEINEKNINFLMTFDEISLLYNNRDFKTNLSPATLEWWRMHRHHRVKVIAASQSWDDFDLKLRKGVFSDLYIVKRSILKSFTVARPVKKAIDIANNTNTMDPNYNGGQVVENYSYLPFFFNKYRSLDKWIKYYDSFR